MSGYKKWVVTIFCIIFSFTVSEQRQIQENGWGTFE